MSVEHMDENFIQLARLRKLRDVFNSIQRDGVESASDRGVNVVAWLDEYLERCDMPSSFLIRKRDEMMRFFDESQMDFADWQDMISLIPLRLAVDGYPTCDNLTPGEIKTMLDIALNANSERHFYECLVTGFDVEGCSGSSRVCSAKATYQLGMDLAAQLVVEEMCCVEIGDEEGSHAALRNIGAIKHKLATEELITEEEFEILVDDLRICESLFLLESGEEFPTE